MSEMGKKAVTNPSATLHNSFRWSSLQPTSVKSVKDKIRFGQVVVTCCAHSSECKKNKNLQGNECGLTIYMVFRYRRTSTSDNGVFKGRVACYQRSLQIGIGQVSL